MHLILDWRVLRHPFEVQVYKRLLILETLCFRGASSILSCKAVLNPFAWKQAWKNAQVAEPLVLLVFYQKYSGGVILVDLHA